MSPDTLHVLKARWRILRHWIVDLNHFLRYWIVPSIWYQVLGPRSSPPMVGALWAPKGPSYGDPLGSQGFPSHGIHWVPKGSPPMASLGLPRVSLPWDPLGSQGSLPWDLIDIKNTNKGFWYLSPNVLKFINNE